MMRARVPQQIPNSKTETFKSLKIMSLFFNLGQEISELAKSSSVLDFLAGGGTISTSL